MSKKRTQYPPEFKAKVVLAALRNEQTMSELAAHYGVHPTVINQWKKALVEGASEIFGKGHKKHQQAEAEVDELYRQIGRLKVERDFLSKKLSL
jgi:transposase